MIVSLLTLLHGIKGYIQNRYQEVILNKTKSTEIETTPRVITEQGVSIGNIHIPLGALIYHKSLPCIENLYSSYRASSIILNLIICTDILVWLADVARVRLNDIL